MDSVEQAFMTCILLWFDFHSTPYFSFLHREANKEAGCPQESDKNQPAVKKASWIGSERWGQKLHRQRERVINLNKVTRFCNTYMLSISCVPLHPTTARVVPNQSILLFNFHNTKSGSHQPDLRMTIGSIVR